MRKRCKNTIYFKYIRILANALDVDVSEISSLKSEKNPIAITGLFADIL
jgi:hypothetical protein